jgi:hypothetical protein
MIITQGRLGPVTVGVHGSVGAFGVCVDVGVEDEDVGSASHVPQIS